jgi:NAD(P)-dependent dehydrogenase (short-subunit alcohol dehydrogenase family)
MRNFNFKTTYSIGYFLFLGSIVNVSSVTGTRSFPGVLPYCISKAALDQFTKCVALG